MKIIMFYDQNWKIASKDNHLHKVEYDLSKKEDRMKALGLDGYDYDDCSDAHTAENVITRLQYDSVDFILQVRIDINNKEYKLISLVHDSENGYSIATDFYYEGHQAGNTYDDLGYISKKEAVRIFNETVKSAIS